MSKKTVAGLRKLSFLGLFGASLLPVYFSQPAVAAGAKLYLSPTASAVRLNSNFKVDLRVDTAGQQTNAVQTSLTYPADKLSVTSVTPASNYNLEVENSYGGGLIKISQAVVPTTVSGDQLVATINFKALAVTGIAQ